MTREGFEPLAWANQGIPREEAERWWEAGFTLAEAPDWRERYGLEDSLRWRAAGVTTLREARSWVVAGIEAGEVAGWRQVGIGFAAAAAWREFGYSLSEARKLRAKGMSPSDAFLRRVGTMRSSRAATAASQQAQGHRIGFMTTLGSPRLRQYRSQGGTNTPMARFVERLHSRNSGVIHGYLQRQWFDDEAATWAEAGIDAADALGWRELGLRPAEAAQLEKSGNNAAATMRAWWQAGIPFDEVAAWLGAGLTPEEAAAQRAAGVTAERAAVMRALRDADTG